VSFTFNNNVSGNSQINQGQNVSAVQNGRGTDMPPAVMDVFEAVKQAIPEESREEIVESVIEPLREMANSEDVNDEGVLERATSLASRLAPFSEHIGRALLGFGEGAIQALTTTNPILRGILSAIQAVRQQ
jgi:hypothetical protein